MFFQLSKGIIALDIDGTVTAQAHEIDPRVIETLNQFAQEGWNIIFMTGRPFQWAESALRSLSFSYVIAVQNGALLIEMPTRKIIMRHLLTQDVIPKMEKVAETHATGFIVYSGLENDDWCYYCSSSFPLSVLTYGLERASFLGEKWQSLSTFSDLPISDFTSVKFFAHEKQALLLSQWIEKELDLHAPPNRDPFNPDYFVIQATHLEAKKGSVLKEFIQRTGITGPVIAAGDDYNDYSMLMEADMKIVMANAPLDLLAIADVVAPPATQLGIIQGLHQAMAFLEKSRWKKNNEQG